MAGWPLRPQVVLRPLGAQPLRALRLLPQLLACQGCLRFVPAPVKDAGAPGAGNGRLVRSCCVAAFAALAPARASRSVRAVTNLRAARSAPLARVCAPPVPALASSLAAAAAAVASPPFPPARRTPRVSSAPAYLGAPAAACGVGALGGGKLGTWGEESSFASASMIEKWGATAK